MLWGQTEETLMLLYQVGFDCVEPFPSDPSQPITPEKPEG